MKRLMSLLLALMLLFSLGTVPASAEDASEIVGAYVFIRAEGDGAENMTQVHEMFASMGMPTTLTLNEDGSAVFSMAGEEFSGVIDFAACTITANGFVDPYVYEDGTLYLDDQDTGATMVFSKDGAAPGKKGVGAFRYFVLTDVLDSDGNSVFSDYEEEADSVTATLFPAGDAIMTDNGDSYVFLFDFDSMTYREEGFDESYPFTLEGDVLTVFVGEERVVLTQADPGWAGPYELVDMSEDLAENFSMDGVEDADPIQMLRLMGMLPTLTIEEDGSGTMSLFFQETELQFDFDTMQVSQDGETIPFTYDKGTLSFGDGESYLSFGRVLALSEDGGLLGMVPGVSDAMPDLGGMPDSAPAVEAPAAEAEGIRCELNGDTLTISGSGELGAVEDLISDAEKGAVRNVVIEEGITGIGDWAFDEWHRLTGVTLPEGLRYINDFAFNECSSLRSVVIPEGVTYIGSWAFDECRGLTAVYLPASLDTVDSFAFDDCDNLANVYYGGTESQWSRISIDSFNDGIRNAEIHFESAISDLETAAAPAAEDAAPIEVGSLRFEVSGDTLIISGSGALNEVPEACLPDRNAAIHSVVIREGIVGVGDSVFDECWNLTDVSFPEGLVYIGDFAFNECEDLERVTLPASLLSIGAFAFDDCDNLEEVSYGGSPNMWDRISFSTFGDSLKSVRHSCALEDAAAPAEDFRFAVSGDTLTVSGSGVLYEIPGEYDPCSQTGIHTVVLEEGITGIGRELFHDCANLTGVSLPEGLVYIGNSAFEGCSFLTTLTLPESVVILGDSSFDGCERLASISIPRGILYIGDWSFSGCNALVDIYFGGTLAQWADIRGTSSANLPEYVDVHFNRAAAVVIEAPPAPPAAAELTVSEIKLFFFDKELSEFTMRVGDDPLDIQAKISPAEAAEDAVLTWSVDDESVLRLMPSDDTHACTVEVLAAKVGGVTITVSSGGCSTQIRVYTVA